MSDLAWSDTLSVEVDEIDDDHRKLIDLYGILKKAVEQGDSADYIEALIEEMISATDAHFKHEERLMIKYRYDGYAGHKEEHDQLIDSALEFKEKLLGDGDPITVEEITYLEDWLTGHILCLDMHLGNYLCKAM